MAYEELSYEVSNELKLVKSEVMKKRFNDLASKFKEVAVRVKAGTITEDEYSNAADEFRSMIDNDEYLNDMSCFDVMIMFLVNSVELELKVRSIRKPKGAYSVPDKVIDGVIMNIVCGEKVADACSFAGISTVTLYNRIKDRGYSDIKEFFKEQKRKLKEEK